MADEQTEPLRQVLIESQYLKKLTFASPKVPEVFQNEAKIDVLLNIRSTNREIDEQHAEVTLIVAVKGVSGSDTIFHLEVAHAGVFAITGYGPEERLEIKGRVCPEILFPFARNTIANAAGKGGFPDVVLKPLDFDKLFAENMRERAAQAAPA